ncbi:FkbM family methyltransferase [Chromobacterium vaccinii]|uniref:FkbM family methyltransferase n=1 Tax=Chromobacterium vaccinii TaxID=1108595 RepID=UPI0016435915|nr:FkbM family methyltransferase [Chromobacterium vaccinii]
MDLRLGGLFEQCLILGQQQQIRMRWSLMLDYPSPNNIEMSLLECIEKCEEYSEVIQSSDVLVNIDSDIPPWIVYLLICNAYEHGDVRLVREYVEFGQKSIVIGGGIGIIATALAQVSRRDVTVIEANPFLLNRLSQTARLNDVDFQIVYGAVKAGVRQGVTKFHISKEFWASSLRKDTWQSTSVIDVPVVDLSSLLMDDYDVAFFDIEGEEEKIFDAIALPQRLSTIFVEIHKPTIGEKVGAKIMNKLWEQGYRLVDSEALTSCWKR